MKAIIFDFDGTILDTESPWFNVYKEIAESYGTTLPLEVWGKCVGTSDKAYYEYLEEQVGEKLDMDKIGMLRKQKHEAFMETQDLRPGVKAYIEAAKEAGYKLAIASSSNYAWVSKFLAKFDLADYFEVIATSDHVTNIKPDPELYTLALEKLGVTADEAMAFEDSPNGTRAAKAAGIQTVIVPNPATASLTFDEYDYKLHSMDELTLSELLDELSSKKSV
ncbi:HAD family hydrolase [Priestia koreensis]|uniref:HAD family hydrolase n=1 Tax=Priestia koreensis TaxID=284581 RepID=UPI001F575D34|nr:HAD family hydrolase [Priestia koreensis]UNL87077.1 HAD family hydrolase [Priestia koreensis]